MVKEGSGMLGRAVLRLPSSATCSLAAVLFLAICPASFAQTTNATLTGFVTDQSKAVMPGVKVEVINVDTGVHYSAVTNSAGSYMVPNLPPGDYEIEVQKQGFKTILRPGIALHVQQAAAINFSMAVGSMNESVTVSGGAPILNTTNGSVSTVVDRNFVKNMPLNGRSFQSLILLTPGAVNASPQVGGAYTGYTGEFDVNGQRSDSNYYTVDGVSANVGTYPYAFGTPGTSGFTPAESALGTTQNLVPLDDLQEFRIDTSTYSAQFGRTPGAQIIFDTRSGTNQWHGDAYDYLRNTVFDANNWFNDYYGFANPGERQNDFGGSLGGPVEIPHVYNGKNKTFFFFSYEGVRLGQPVPATVSYVPDNALRAAAPAALQPILHAFPVQNGPEVGNGLAEFIGTGTTPSSLDSANIRVDKDVNPKLHMFFRFANTSSNAGFFGEFNNDFGFQSTVFQNTRTYTVGTDSVLSSSLSNEFRFGYNHNLGGRAETPKAFGGSVPVNMAAEAGLPDTNTFNSSFGLLIGNVFPLLTQGRTTAPLTQWNLVDTLGWTHGRQQLKFGADYRQTLPTMLGSGNPYLFQYYFSGASLLANAGALSGILVNNTVYPVFVNSGLFVQDDWQVAPRLTLNMGLRWEVDPAPGNHHHTAAYTLQNAGDPANATVAPYGTPLYETAWYNFAPRFGAAYLLRTSPGWETVLRGGAGVFFDTGQQIVPYAVEYGAVQAGYGAETYDSFSWPFTPAEVNSVTISNPPAPPYGFFAAFPKHFQLPYTLEYNMSLQQAFGSSQTLTISYVGSHASRLPEYSQDFVGFLNPDFGYITYVTSGLTSDYNSLQLQYQRRMSRGLQALASYTFAHCIDYSSNDYSDISTSERGNCDYDVRHNFSAAFSYEPPNVRGNAFLRGVLDHWGFDDRFTARTGFPITLYGSEFVDPVSGAILYGGLNTVPGQPYWLYGSQYPGGRAVNPAAFALPPAGQNQIGDASRNFLTGFGAWQMDLAIRREFPIYERVNLQFRADAFNIFNHPNFGEIYAYYAYSTPSERFGQAIATLNQSLGALSPLYQMGGPRSLQLSLRLSF